jgi:hypothetical protein
LSKHECFGCTKRKVGCRETCKSWIAYEEAKIKELDKKRKAKDYKERSYLENYHTYRQQCKKNRKLPISFSEYADYLEKKECKYKYITNF